MKNLKPLLYSTLALLLVACDKNDSSINDSSTNQETSSSEVSSIASSTPIDYSSQVDSSGYITDTNSVSEISTSDSTSQSSSYVLDSQDGDTYTFKDSVSGETATISVSCVSGTNSYTIDGNTLTFKDITEDSEFSVTGKFYGNIVVDVAEDYEFDLDLEGLDLYSYSECPINFNCADSGSISAKKGTINNIYDMREAVTDDDDISSSIYAKCDLEIKGKGSLNVYSENNNGIHTKDDLEVKNLTLQVECEDNALKGNDSVTIESGTLTLISRVGDGIKTSNSDISSKGNQRGTIEITGGTILIYAACDGIDASYDVKISDDDSTKVEIYTNEYSRYSEEVIATSESSIYIRSNSNNNYKYSLKFTNDDGDIVWKNTTTAKTSGMSNIYTLEKPSGYTYVQVYTYTSSQTQGQADTYYAKSGVLRVNEYYDTISISNRGSSYYYSWTNYSTTTQGGKGGFGGGMQDEGNTDKLDYSAKGIKADNEVKITGGEITVSAYDDAIHANSDVELENGETPTGDVTISGGIITISSHDDGIHADGTLAISGGTITVTKSYEGLEGNIVDISGGTISAISSDDGINGTAETGEAIKFTGGYTYIYAGGDGIDSNSTTSYDGILFDGGNVVVISTSGGNSCIDSERGYKYVSGNVIGIMPSNGMTSEVTKCSNSSKMTTKSVSASSYIEASNVVVVKMPKSMSAFVIVLSDASTTISAKSSTSDTLDANGVCWKAN